MNTAQEIYAAIIGGEVDEDLNTVVDAINARRKALTEIKALAFKIGDRVVTANLRPKYMEGLPATILRKEGAKFVIEIDADQVTRRYKKVFSVKPAMLEAV